MYEVRKNRAVTRSPADMVSVSKWIYKINTGYILIIIAITVLLTRSIGVINSYKERGAYPYIQMLNFAMPIVETEGYDELDFTENKLSLKRVILEAMGLYNINPLDIVGRELSIFQGENTKSFDAKKLLGITPFKLEEDSVLKITPEEIAELNKQSPAYDASLKKPLDNSKPEVLLYSTHNTEAYAEGGRRDIEDNNYNVVGVAEVLAKELEEGYGISVIHDKTSHNSGSYDESYNRSQQTLINNLEQHDSLKLVIDIHRDSVGDNKAAVTTNINGQDLARIMFCRAENSERYAANKNLTDELQATADEIFPGFSRSIHTFTIGKLASHQKLSDGALLIEVGADINSAQEAKLSAKYIARIIAEHLNK